MIAHQDGCRICEAYRHPTEADVLRVVSIIGPCTMMQVAGWFSPALGLGGRGTIRNRLLALEASGAIIRDEERPMQFAINDLATT